MDEEYTIFTKQEMTNLVTKYLSSDYTLNWYITDQLTVFESPTEWVNQDIIVTTDMKEQRDNYMNQQRQLMNAAIALVRGKLIDGV